MALFGIVFGACLILLFLMAPAGRSRGKNPFFGVKWFAHRGLHGAGVSENSRAAFQLAMEKRYGIELDVHLTKDGQLAVFHDDSLMRLCSVPLVPEECTLQELKAHLLPDGQRIPSFPEVLEQVRGNVPLIVEIKSPRIGKTEVARRTWEALESYQGQYLVQSFDPFQLRWFKRNKPQVIRGQLAQKVRIEGPFRMKHLPEWLAGNLLFNRISSPDYVAYRQEDTKKLCFRLMQSHFHAPLAVWTVKTEAEAQHNQTICHVQIFEGFQPHQ